jgi:hypothetical protein
MEQVRTKAASFLEKAAESLNVGSGSSGQAFAPRLRPVPVRVAARRTSIGAEPYL